MISIREICGTGQEEETLRFAERAQMWPTHKKDLHPKRCKSLKLLVAGAGFEPATFGL
jgi:hypothetical protein